MSDSLQAIPIKRFRHLAVIALLYGLTLMLSILLLDPTRGGSLILGAPVAISSVVLIAIWTVLGPESFSKRLALSLVTSVLIACCGGIGFYYFVEMVDGDFPASLCLAEAVFIAHVMVVAAQVPFWFFRFFAGWRLTYKNENPINSVPLGEIFAIMFIFGLAFAAPQIGDKLILDEQLNQIRVGSNTTVWVTDPNGIMFGRTVTVTNENIAELKSKATQNQFVKMTDISVSCAVAVLIFSVFSLPLFWFTFRTKMAFIYCLTYGGVCLAAVALVTHLTQGSFMGFLQPIPLVIVATVLVLGISTPLMISRGLGFSLTSSRKPGIAKTENVANPADSNAGEPRIDAMSPME